MAKHTVKFSVDLDKFKDEAGWWYELTFDFGGHHISGEGRTIKKAEKDFITELHRILAADIQFREKVQSIGKAFADIFYLKRN